MKKLTAFIIAIAVTSVAWSQKEIKLEEVGNYVGDSVKVCGKILTGRYLDRSEAGPTLLNMGKPYPDQLLTVVIYKRDRKNFDIVPEVELLNKDVCVTGVVVIYKEKPQMILYSKEQLVVHD
jgi:hypothetical protein